MHSPYCVEILEFICNKTLTDGQRAGPYCGTTRTAARCSYFGIQGPAEQARLCLVLAGIDFEDERLKRPEMLARRENAPELMPLGNQLPTLQVGDTVLTQSNAIGVYCSKLAGLHPSDPLEAARVDEMMQYITQDIRERVISPTMRIKDPEEKAAARDLCNREKLPAKFAAMEKRVRGPLAVRSPMHPFAVARAPCSDRGDRCTAAAARLLRTLRHLWSVP